MKYDMKGGGGSSFGEDEWLPGEPLFVAKKEAGSTDPEDDGYLLSLASHATEERAQLWILNASDMSMRARVTVDAAIPLGFHGQFFRA